MEANNPKDINQKQTALIEAKLKLENQFKRGVNWFFWIAGLSLINSVILLLGGGLNFLIGLGITQVIDGIATGIATDIAPETGTVAKIIAFFVDICIAGLFVVFGALAGKRYKWSFIIGMILYALDGLIFLIVADFWSFGFHLFALYGLYGGLRAHRKLGEIEEKAKTLAT